MTRRSTAVTVVAVLALLVAAASVTIVLRGRAPGALRFAPFDLAAFSAKLAPLLVIAALIERTFGVFFGIWTDPVTRERDRKAAAAR
jgi:hypothetical protein